MAVASAARKESRTPGIFNAVLAVLALAVIVPLALIASQQPPPAIAEFAPQDQQQIKKAPNSQSGDQGQGQGQADILGQALPSPSPSGAIALVLPTASPVDVARVRRCVGNPPRQTEDPQSPPCVPYFQGDNGGSTYSHGVTRTTINVAFPGSVDPNIDREIDAMAAYFNRRFEFYGRQIKAVHNAWVGAYFNPTTQSMINDATKVDQESHAFMATSRGYASFGDDGAFRDTLARHGVMSTNGDDSYVTEANMSTYQPYEWSSVPGLDRQQRYLGDFMCTMLAGRPPRLAPAQPSLAYPAGPPVRRWALFTNKPETGGNAPDASILHNAMAGCGATPLVEDVLPASNDSNITKAVDNDLTQMASKDVTTVLCLCGQWVQNQFMVEADKQHRHPEWVISTSFQLDRDDIIGNQEYFPSDQSSNAFGVSWFNQPLPPDESFWNQAEREVDPTKDPYYSIPAGIYRDLLLIASGIQMAGPNLTPATFQAGMYKTRFSNSGNGAAPYYEANVGFAPGAHSEYEDARLIWWNPGGHSYNSNAPGTFCAVNNGQRYFVGGLPKNDQGFKSGTC